MSDEIHRVRFEPVGVEMDVNEGETVLDAAFRQGVSLMHGCKEGQCSSCKALLVDGDIELLKYSTFALPDYQKETGHVLLCRTLANRRTAELRRRSHAPVDRGEGFRRRFDRHHEADP
jgi:propane monooxygenase reductase component